MRKILPKHLGPSHTQYLQCGSFSLLIIQVTHLSPNIEESVPDDIIWKQEYSMKSGVLKEGGNILCIGNVGANLMICIEAFMLMIILYWLSFFSILIIIVFFATVSHINPLLSLFRHSNIDSRGGISIDYGLLFFFSLIYSSCRYIIPLSWSLSKWQQFYYGLNCKQRHEWWV